MPDSPNYSYYPTNRKNRGYRSPKSGDPQSDYSVATPNTATGSVQYSNGAGPNTGSSGASYQYGSSAGPNSNEPQSQYGSSAGPTVVSGDIATHTDSADPVEHVSQQHNGATTDHADCPYCQQGPPRNAYNADGVPNTEILTNYANYINQSNLNVSNAVVYVIKNGNQDIPILNNNTQLYYFVQSWMEQPGTPINPNFSLSRGVFTIPESGVYRFTSTLYVTPSIENTTLFLSVQTESAVLKEVQKLLSSGPNPVNITVDSSLSKGQVISLRVRAQSTLATPGTITILVGSPTNQDLHSSYIIKRLS